MENTLIFLKTLNIEIYGLTNIDNVKINKLDKYLFFDKIFTNNNESCKILNSLLKKK